MRRCSTAFTLIELLVVMLIIVIMAALLMPTIGYARYRAKTVVCMSNMRQWGLAAQAYAAENRGAFPRFDISGGTGENTWDVSNSLMPKLAEYGLHRKYWFCPLDSRTMAQQDAQLVYYGYFSMIGYEWWVPRKNGGVYYPVGYPTRLSDTNAPILTDRAASRVSGSNPTSIDSATGPHMWGGRVHDGNVLYSDGRVENVPASRMTSHYLGNWYNFW